MPLLSTFLKTRFSRAFEWIRFEFGESLPQFGQYGIGSLRLLQTYLFAIRQKQNLKTVTR